MSRSWLIIPLLLLYVIHLGGVGLLGPDEPRYASVGREMFRSGDFITPRLDGAPWFEKPPLLYWMVAAGHWLRLPQLLGSEEWAARLPVALMSVAFLVFFHRVLTREFSLRLATMATAILATSAGWTAYSFTALTDLPMSAALGAAMLISIFDTRPGFDTRLGSMHGGRTPWVRGLLAGALLGLAILGKGFVPVVLFAPLLLIARGKRLGILAGALVVAAPWHVLCLMQNGRVFWDDYFWKQHIARFFSPALEHVQPFWYYVPVAVAGLFPWSPLVGLLGKRKLYDDSRVRLLAAWFAYGFIFFSASTNKLPGYLLPLMPALAIVLAAALDKAPKKEWWLAGCGALLVILPTAAEVLPDALLSGLSRAPITFMWSGLVFGIVAALVWWVARQGQTELATLAVALTLAVGITVLKYRLFPMLDRDVSVRAFVRENRGQLDNVCLQDVSRASEYGLNYYVEKSIPKCQREGKSLTGDRPGLIGRGGRLNRIFILN